MSKERFNVIVVGGGPVGLTTAHTFSKAGIDFTILERRETILEDIGATIFLWPQGMRILAQLGLLESVREIGLEPQLGSQQEHSGLMFGTINSPEWCNEHFNVWPLTMARADLVKRLYDSLPDDARSHIHANKKVTSITPLSESGGCQRMRVACADGSAYDGTIVIGADGVHSAVRKAMAIAPEFPFQAKYRVLWFHYPRIPETEATIIFEVHGKGLMLQILSTETSSFALLYQRLDKPYRGYVRYGDEDMEALAAKAGFLPVGKKGRTLRDVWAIRTKAGMANLEEGYLKKVYEGGRMVVIGDAAHKVTPHSGLGLNDGISDVVSLVNELGRALQSGLEEGKAPVERELESAFVRHQKTRMPAIKRGNQVSWLSVRQGTWRNKGLWLMDRVILKLPGVDHFVFRKVVVPLIQQGLVLDCVKEQDEPFAGKTAWKNPIKGVKEKV